MFNSKSKIRALALALAMSFLTVISGKAVGDFNPAREEEAVIAILKNYKNVRFEIREDVNKILDEIERERQYWSLYLDSYSCSGIYRSETNHPELYYLWLVEKFDKIFNIIEEDDFAMLWVRSFIDKLLGLVFELNKSVYYCFQGGGWSVARLRCSLTGTPGRYSFEKT